MRNSNRSAFRWKCSAASTTHYEQRRVLAPQRLLAPNLLRDDKSFVEMLPVILNLVILSLSLNANSQNCHPRKTILISLDGFWYGYIDRLRVLLGQQSNIVTLMERSAHAPDGIKSNYPTITFANHISMITGEYVENHGIVGKTFYDPATGKDVNVAHLDSSIWSYVKGEPVWAAYAKKHGQSKVACISWLGCNAPYHGIQLNNTVPFSQKMTWTFKVDKIIKWLKNGVDLILFYYPEPDGTGHSFGPYSVEMDQILKELDGKVGYLLRSLKNADLYEHVNLIITSDHGMAKVDSVQVIPRRPDLYHRWVKHDSYWLIQPKAGKTQATLDYLKPFTQRGKVSVFRKENIPAYWHFKRNDRIPEILVAAEPGVVLRIGYSGTMAGQHGYGSGSKRMRPIFMAHGASFNHHVNVTTKFATSDTNLIVRQSMCLPLPSFADKTYMRTVLPFVKY
uniref:Extracellular Endonuclease subunit A domain-containing protein n=1 Tax=Trichuris muris TaxID=70415 RepID=A0A5S6R3K8_TRIMR